ncbi:MAG: NADH-quinone oxidoreductase subunit NuoG [Armatimonadetes bacterium]|nr:NADH-quinone oxidoreductase subunit NuoG [Armatimonadota bacterium]
MAAVAQETTVNLTINAVEIAVPKGELIVEAVKRLGLEIPVFCYHPRMKPVGMCRMCLVEVGFKQPDGSVRMMPKPQAACTLPASEGMVVLTDSEAVHRDRKGVLEFLLINHPLDCPVCDRGGECPLQNNTIFYGPGTSRFVEAKRNAHKAYPLSDYVTLDLERCIQCGRCVRFTEEISGDGELAFRFRGAQMQPSTFGLKNFDSKFSGNVIEICPVGALTNSKYRFRARPWDLQTSPAICTLCSNGCNVWMDWRVGQIMRINGRTHEGINEEWTCDLGKFGHDRFNADSRPTQVLIRNSDHLAPSNWGPAYKEIEAAFAKGGAKVAALAGGILSNEDSYLLQKLFRQTYMSANLDHRFTATLQKPEDRLESKLGIAQVQDSIASFESKCAVLIFGSSLADEEPILFLRVRKAWFNNGAKVIVAGSQATDADSFAHLVLRCKPGTESALANGLLSAAIESGNAKVPDATRKALAEFTPERVEALTGVSAASLREAASMMGPGAAVVTTHGLFNLDNAQGALEILGGLAMTTGASFNCCSREANHEGLVWMGVLPDRLPGGAAIPTSDRGLNTHEILDAAASGKLKALWLAGVDPFKAHPDRKKVEKALENVDFLVVQDCLDNEAIPYASVVLPMAAPAETEGSYVSMERRVQAFGPVLTPKGDAKPAWRVFADLILRATPQRPSFDAREIRAAIAEEAPAFAAAIDIADEGVMLG